MDNFFKHQAIEKIKIPDKADKLSKKCSSMGNPITFQGVGTNKYGESNDLENLEIKPNIAKTEEQIYLFKELLKTSKIYLNGPIFTDNFHKDHGKRRNFEDVWEKKIAEKEITREDQEILDYYNSNRLGINSILGIIGFLNLLIDTEDIEDDTKNKLISILNKVPRELFEKDEDGCLLYQNLEDLSNQKGIGKVEVMVKFSDLVRKIVSILEK